ncbi:MAG: M15 family metallopeptidase [Clostridiales Family XIII bacterium]|jgi:hypothetical protein|nr:M15 family metallopeptidase [Clostridiales Family XIII bacterium]
MKKKTMLVGLLCFMLVVALIPGSASAYDPYYPEDDPYDQGDYDMPNYYYDKYLKELVGAGILTSAEYGSNLHDHPSQEEANATLGRLAGFLRVSLPSAQLPDPADAVNMSRASWFMLLADTAWQLGRTSMLPHAIKPSAPAAQGNSKYYKSSVYFNWSGGPDAVEFELRFYNKNGTLIKTLPMSVQEYSGSYGSLSLSDYSQPTVKGVFGSFKTDLKAYLCIVAIDRYGVRSALGKKLNFTIEPYSNFNEKLFGTQTGTGFKNPTEARKYQRTVTIKIWRLVGGKKVGSTTRITVNRGIADDVVQIFNEIYKGSEKFPVKAIGGFQVRGGRSEHNYGTAIDINPTENCMKDGNKVVAGSFWKPGKNPYSIKQNGDVVKAFAKYGWYWGGYGWGNRKDYMHFSRLGT